VKLTARDAALVFAIDVTLLILITGYARWKVG
jgi:hypothetical protein